MPLVTKLNVQTFVNGWKLLNERFNHSCGENIMMIYYNKLCDKLTDKQCEIAITECVAEELFFPSATIILGKVKADNEEIAISEWNKIEELCPQYVIASATNSRFDPDIEEDTLQVLREVGGWSALNNASEKDFAYKKRDFIKLYQIKIQSQSRQDALDEIGRAHV